MIVPSALPGKRPSKSKRMDMLVWSAFFVFGVVSIVTPVVLPEIARSFSSNYAQGGGLEAGRNLALGLILISAGLFAQRWDKKLLLVFGFFLSGGGLIVMSIAGNYLELLLGMVIVGLGCGLIEALLSPLITDIHPGDDGTHMNFSHAFFHVGVVLSVILFGELMMQGVSWRVVYLVGGGAALAVGCSIYAIRFPPSMDVETGVHGVGEVLCLPWFWVFAVAMFVSAGIEAAFLFWSASYVQLYFSDVSRAGAFGMAVFGAAMVVGRMGTARLSGRFGVHRIMVLSAIGGAVISIAVVWTQSLWGIYVLLGLAGIAIACFWPSILVEAGQTLKVGPILLLDMLAFCGVLGIAATTWLVGILADQTSLKTAFLQVTIAWFLILLGVLLVPKRILGQSAV